MPQPVHARAVAGGGNSRHGAGATIGAIRSVSTFGRLGVFMLLLLSCRGAEHAPRLVIGTTHTVEDSGLLSVLMAAHREQDNESRRPSVVVAGSGEILTMAARGDVDVVLIHSPDDERTLIASGQAESREAVMHNDFVIAGPAADPASVAQAATAADAFRRVAATRQPFVSRGDESGTHRREQALWAAAGEPARWDAFVEAGTGMADALRVAAARRAYILADRATFERFGHELGLVALHEGDPVLRNQYSVMVMSHTANAAGARAFSEWVRSDAVQRLIRDYRVEGTGRALFMPDAGDSAPR